MRTPCKYAHEVTYLRWVDGKVCNITMDECWAEKEPTVCDVRRREICGEYKPIKKEDVPKWYEFGYDEHYGRRYKCVRCGYEVLGCNARNYCPHCGYEYKPWDGTVFK